MTPAELAAIKARADAASSGPWEAVLLNDDTDSSTVDTGREEYVIASAGSIPWPVPADVQAQIHANIRFIAAARADIPALLAEIDILDEKIAALRLAFRAEFDKRGAAEEDRADFAAEIVEVAGATWFAAYCDTATCPFCGRPGGGETYGHEPGCIVPRAQLSGNSG